MSTLVTRTIQTPDASPVSFPNGIRIGSATGAGSINNIGVPGQQGFGVGIAPSLPANFAKLYGTDDPASDAYGNYQYTDGSVMVYMPAFYYKYGTGSNGLAINVVDVKAFGAYADVATANAAGYALHRAFYNGGTIRPGVFVDKYFTSNNNGTASSLKNGVPLASAQRGSIASTAFATLTGAPANAFHGSIPAAKTRGSQFFVMSRFIRSALALLANAHASASTNTTYCAWYSAGSTNFPKGNNNNALGDTNDASIAYLDDGTATNCGKTGSANFFSKTTHNGQNCGVADVNGTLWSIEPFGITSNGTNFYLLNQSVDVTTITSGTTLATDAWGATGLAAMYTSLGATYESLTAAVANKTFGSASQVLSAATSGTAWAAAGAGIPLVAGTGGSNQFGNDFMYDARPNELCVISGGYWLDASLAGVWALSLNNVRSTSDTGYGFRAASYL
jgi:hypothetical protein